MTKRMWRRKSKAKKNKIVKQYVRFHSSIYSRVVIIIAALSALLLGTYVIIFRTVNEHFLQNLIYQNGNNVGAIVEGALYHSMLRNDKTELYNTLDLINTLSGIDEVELYDNTDYMVYTSYSTKPIDEYEDPDCMNCHLSLDQIFPGEEKTYHIIDGKSKCEMFLTDNNERYLLIRNPILNESSCFTADCHAHFPEETMLGSLIIKMPLGQLDTSIRESSTKYFLFALSITVLVALFLVFFTQKNVKRPLNALIDASLSVARGETETRLQPMADELDDIKLVSYAFNKMLDKLQAANIELENWSRQLEYKVRKKSEELSSVQQELIQIERIASLGKLSSSVAHELNNPLSGILVYTKLVHKQLSNPNLDEEKKQGILSKLKLIENETKRCGDIVKGLLDFSRKDDEHQEISHLHDILESTHELMKHPMKMKNISFNKHFTATADLIQCTPNQIKQACIAMIVNASEAMQPNITGEITLHTFNPDPNSVRISIIDNGRGMDPENIEHIFEPFYSTKHEASGIGLGLAIVHGIIQSHKAKIEVSSELGKGTAFHITFPLLDQNKQSNA